jgi:hypothetical protein
MKETPSRQPVALPETNSSSRRMHAREDWEEAIALAAANAQEPWACLGLWFTNRNFLARHKSRANSENPKADE